MRPCNNCKRRKNCSIVEFLEKNYEQSPWSLESYLNQKFSNVSIISAVSGNKDSIVLECDDYDPIKSETDYSYLAKPVRKLEPTSPPPPSKCGGCKGKCGH